MNINRNNYEVFFLLYVDQELNEAEKLEVEEFLRSNPDLQVEMDMLSSVVLPQETPTAVFPDKSRLFRTEDTNSLVNISNHESFFVQYTDDELNNEEKAATEQFVYTNPEFQAEFELIQKTKLRPDTGIVFPDKDLLYRKEESRVRPMFPVWARYAAAALLVLSLGVFWMRQEKNSTTSIASTESGKENIHPAPTESRPDLAARLKEPAEKLEKEVKIETQLPQKNQHGAAVSDQLAVNQKKSNPATKPTTSNTALPAASLPELSGAVRLPAIGSIAHKIEEPDAGSIAKLEVPNPKDRIIPVKTSDQTIIVVAMNDQNGDDFVFVPGKEVVRKTPLRGLLRKASRFIDKNNPLSEDRAKSGVFTASNEQ
ncbi:hypothetical protein [Flavihumibacter sp. UBA7668]|uniref:hypothetical protein n=1 Tax=Flavihumibacter sp. UBA7668 TaxID=1946542 RepID=UPI0025C54981|nr:hypothetical protein [Flavihumibacter sp. UBA7668]